MTQDDFLELRAALIQLEKALETERACVIRVRKVLERLVPTEAQTVTISANDSISGIIT